SGAHADPGVCAQSMTELNLAERDPYVDGHDRDARAQERPESVEAEHGGQRQGDPHVEAQKRRTCREDADGDGEPDLGGARMFVLGSDEELARSVEQPAPARADAGGLRRLKRKARHGPSVYPLPAYAWLSARIRHRTWPWDGR